MKAAAIRGHGDADVIELLDLPDPAPGEGQVVVEVRSAALNHLDIWVRKGGRAKIPLPHVLGSDAAGVVAQLGAGVTGLDVGDPVVVNPGLACGRCDYCLRGQQSECSSFGIVGLTAPGTFAEKVVVPAANVRPKPAHLSFDQAAGLSLAYLTAWRMLMTRARLRPGETVLIHGIGGGVAVAGLQLARLMGGEVIATSSSDAKCRRAAELGASRTINYRQTPDVATAVRDFTNGLGVDVVLDTVGAATWQTNFDAVRRGGRIVHCGVTTGAQTTVSIQQLYWNQITVMGSTLGGAEDFRLLLRAVASAKLVPVVDSVEPLANARAAIGRMEEGKQFGKIVLHVKD
jgi:NADPH:quinone reductase-like Zn-dependent oxidoreductase